MIGGWDSLELFQLKNGVTSSHHAISYYHVPLSWFLSLAPSSCHGIRMDLDLRECDEADCRLDLAVEVRLAWRLGWRLSQVGSTSIVSLVWLPSRLVTLSQLLPYVLHFGISRVGVERSHERWRTVFISTGNQLWLSPFFTLTSSSVLMRPLWLSLFLYKLVFSPLFNIKRWNLCL